MTHFAAVPSWFLGADERLKGCEMGNWRVSGRVFDVRILFSKRITGNLGCCGCIFDGEGERFWEVWGKGRVLGSGGWELGV